MLIPKENERDLEDVPDNVREELEIIPVSLIDEVLNVALSSPPQKISEDKEDVSGSSLTSDVSSGEDIVAH